MEDSMFRRGLIVAALFFAVGLGTASRAQNRITIVDPATPADPANTGVFTSVTTHSVGTAFCNPHCDHPPYDQGDWYTFQEVIPYALDQATAHLICDGVGCVFD